MTIRFLLKVHPFLFFARPSSEEGQSATAKATDPRIRDHEEAPKGGFNAHLEQGVLGFGLIHPSGH